MKVIVLTDHEYLFKSFCKIVKKKEYDDFSFDYFCSNKRVKESLKIPVINLINDFSEIINNYSVLISLHFQLILPANIINNIRCINIHPGLNPYNRGWFPHVFSIINGKPMGVTIHEMDEKIDNGPIIIQKEIKGNSYDTSEVMYGKILKLEIELLDSNLLPILKNNYSLNNIIDKGNINSKKDFKDLCKINLDKTVTFREAINYFRALSYEGYDNAYFVDENGNKIFVTIDLKLE